MSKKPKWIVVLNGNSEETKEEFLKELEKYDNTYLEYEDEEGDYHELEYEIAVAREGTHGCSSCGWQDHNKIILLDCESNTNKRGVIHFLDIAEEFAALLNSKDL